MPRTQEVLKVSQLNSDIKTRSVQSLTPGFQSREPKSVAAKQTLNCPRDTLKPKTAIAMCLEPREGELAMIRP